jgi:acetyl-CoA carboxylase carboxyltransferase component
MKAIRSSKDRSSSCWKDDQPVTWEAEAQEIARRRAFADGLGGPEAIAKQHAAGRLTIRERVGSLVDAGSFQEVGRLTGTATYKDGALERVMPAPYVMGLARIDGRPVAIGGEDFTVRGGTSWGSDRRKGGQGGFVEDLAHEYRIPLVNLIDGSGGTVTSACTGSSARSICSAACRSCAR